MANFTSEPVKCGLYFDLPAYFPRTKKIVDGRGTKYTSQGILKENGMDLCDCLDVDCCGCFMPCPRCSSNKCGHECRQSRRWMYDGYEIEGTKTVITNPFTKK